MPGLICICPSEKADFRMDMYNAEGSRSGMCGDLPAGERGYIDLPHIGPAVTVYDGERYDWLRIPKLRRRV